jgi:hypothetical protein
MGYSPKTGVSSQDVEIMGLSGAKSPMKSRAGSSRNAQWHQRLELEGFSTVPEGQNPALIVQPGRERLTAATG